MDKETKFEIESLRENLADIADRLSKAHKLASMLNMFCKANINNDELYEVSYAAEELENMLQKLGFAFYSVMNDNKRYKNIDEVLRDIKTAIKHRKVELVED